MKKQEPPRLARNVTPVYDLVEQYIRDLRHFEELRIEPSQDSMTRLRDYSVGLAQFVLRGAAIDLERAAGAGIGEAVALSLDPNYYERRRKRSKEVHMKRVERREQEQKAQQEIQEKGYTKAQIAARARQIEQQDEWRRKWLAEEIAELEEMKKSMAVEGPEQ